MRIKKLLTNVLESRVRRAQLIQLNLAKTTFFFFLDKDRVDFGDARLAVLNSDVSCY